MSRLLCRVGVLEHGLVLPPDPYSLGGRRIEEYFREGSRAGGGESGVELAMDASRFEPQGARGARGKPASLYALHHRLSELTGNPSRGGPVDTIGLIFAGSYQGGPDVLGVMFDGGLTFAGEQPVARSYRRVPREGCVVFLDAIRRLRGGGSALNGAFQDAFHDEVVFTAIHELGHVLNLWHVDSPRSFMVRGFRRDPEPPSSWRFLEVHREFLARGASSRYVWPGGSAFGERGELGPSDEKGIVSYGRG